MRLHIEMDPRVVSRIDRVAGSRGRSAFIRRAVELALEHGRRWELIQSARGVMKGKPHDWDSDPAEWVRVQRRGDLRRLG